MDSVAAAQMAGIVSGKQHHGGRHGGGFLSIFGLGGNHHHSGHESLKTREHREEMLKQMQLEAASDESRKRQSNGLIDASSSDGDVSSGSEAGSDNDDDMDDGYEGVEEFATNQEVANLPSSTKMQEIFQKLKNFKLSKIMVNNVLQPVDRLNSFLSLSKSAQNQKEDLEKMINPVDSQLEKNIKLLFTSDNDKYDLDKIIESIVAYTRNPDKKTTSKDQEKIIATDKKKLRQNNTEILKFYPHLLNAMKALIVYIRENSETKGKLPEIEYDKRAYYAWKEVFSYLKSIQLAIYFGATNEQLNLGNYPRNFSVIITNMEKNTKKINRALMQKRGELQQINDRILKRDKEVLEINQKYNGIENHKSDLKGKLDTLLTLLRQSEDPVEIARENIALLSSDTT